MECCDKINPIHSTPSVATRPKLPEKTQKTEAKPGPNFN